MNPLTVAVLDDGGNLVAFAKEGGGPLRESVARGKAWGAVGMGRSSRALGQLGEERPMFMQALIDASGGAARAGAGRCPGHEGAHGGRLGGC